MAVHEHAGKLRLRMTLLVQLAPEALSLKVSLTVLLNYTHDAQELVEKKLELAELHEEMLKINHRQAAGRSS